MKPETKEAIKEYLCSGCVGESFEDCYTPFAFPEIMCRKHVSGTIVSGVGSIFLGLPKGFCRKGPIDFNPIYLFEKFEDGWGYNKFNIPVWKYLNKHGHTLVRGLSPRINFPFIHIFLEDCIDEIDCLEITQDDINEMD